MHLIKLAAPGAIALVLSAGPTHACQLGSSMDLRDIFQAETILGGRIMGADLLDGTSGEGDISVQILAGEVFKGTAPRMLTVVVEGSTPSAWLGGEAKWPVVIVALRSPDDDRPDLPVVMGDRCSGFFLFERNSDLGRAADMILDGDGDAEVEAAILAEFLNADGSDY